MKGFFPSGAAGLRGSPRAASVPVRTMREESGEQRTRWRRKQDLKAAHKANLPATLRFLLIRIDLSRKHSFSAPEESIMTPSQREIRAANAVINHSI